MKEGSTAGGPTADPVTVAGRTILFPVEVRDASLALAIFPASSDVARELIGDPSVNLAESRKGRTTMTVVAVRYTDTDLDPYDEIGLVFPTRLVPGKATPWIGMVLDNLWGKAGSFVHRLPVSTAFSAEAGRTLWGLPKTHDALAIDDAPRRRVARWNCDGRHVLTLTLPRGGSRRFGPQTQVTLARAGGTLLQTAFTASGTGFGFRLGAQSADLELGDHPIADEIRRLGVPRKPSLTAWVESLQASYQPAVPA